MGFMDMVIRWIGYLIPFIASLAVVFFIWGLVKFIYHADKEDAKEEGRGMMVWGMIALFIIVSLWGIIGYLQASLGFQGGDLGNAPSVPGAPVPVPGS